MRESTAVQDDDLTSLRLENLSIRTLYKFRTWDPSIDVHGQDILKQNILYFSSVRDFNDPAEGRIPLRYDLVPDEYILKTMLQHVGEEFPNLTEEEQISLCHTYVAQEVFKDPAEAKWRSELQAEYAANSYGVASLAEELENVVLWSHYSNMHQGYCVGLDIRSLLRHRHVLAANARIVIDLYKVRYTRRMPELIPSELSTEVDPIVWTLICDS